VDDDDSGRPTGNDDRGILQKLPDVVASPALEDPHFVQEEMADNRGEVGNRNRDERW
jgi:hypothetical protein